MRENGNPCNEWTSRSSTSSLGDKDGVDKPVKWPIRILKIGCRTFELILQWYRMFDVGNSVHGMVIRHRRSRHLLLSMIVNR